MTINNVSYSVAGLDDVEDVEALLSQTDMPGWITLSYQCDLVRAPKMSPNGHSQSVIGRDKSGVLAGMASRQVTSSFWAGKPAQIAWFSNLRLALDFRNRPSVLCRGFDMYRASLHKPQDTPWYLASILSDNTAARRLLERGLAGFPTFRRLFGFQTLAFSAKRVRPALPIRAALPEDASAIVSFLNQQNHTRPLAPVLERDEDFSAGRYPGLAVGDFLVCEGGGEIIGVVALWDQVPFRRLVVANYAAGLSRLRLLINLVAPFTGLAKLPPQGEHLAMAYLSFFTVRGDDPKVAQSLFDAARTAAKRRGLSFVSTSFAEDDPLLLTLSKNKHRAYPANIYGVTWSDDGALPDASCFSLSKIEIAML